MKEQILKILDEGKKYGYSNEAVAGELLGLFSVSGSTLPTDTEITKEAKKDAEWEGGETYQTRIYGFECGAKWMRNKLK